MTTAQRRSVSEPVDTPSTVDEDETPTVGKIDVEALIAQLQAQADKQQAFIEQQQIHIAKLLEDRGIPADATAAQIAALQAHLRAQASANPLHAEAYAPVLSYVDKLLSAELTTNKAYKARNLVEELHDTHAGHELAYARSLAKGLHTMTLDPESDE